MLHQRKRLENPKSDGVSLEFIYVIPTPVLKYSRHLQEGGETEIYKNFQCVTLYINAVMIKSTNVLPKFANKFYNRFRNYIEFQYFAPSK